MSNTKRMLKKVWYVLVRPAWLVFAAVGMVNAITAHGTGDRFAYLINSFVMAFGISVAFERDC